MSADRWFSFGPLERRSLALAFACTACFSIDLFDDLNPSQRTPARYIEKLCKSGNYELEGSGELTTGLTDDSCGFSLGPEAGAVRFIVPGEDLIYDTHMFEILVAKEDGTNARWDQVPGDAGNVYSVSARVGETTRIIDVRIEGTFLDDTGCAIARRRMR